MVHLIVFPVCNNIQDEGREYCSSKLTIPNCLALVLMGCLDDAYYGGS